MSQFPVLYNAFDKVLKPVGFKRRADHWYRRTAELVQLINLQKSPWGKQYFINIAWWLNDLGTEQFPKEHRSHLRLRCNTFLSQDRRELDRLLDFEDHSMSPDGRAALVASFFVDNVLPFLEQTNTLARLREICAAGDWPPGFLATGPARDLIGMPPLG